MADTTPREALAVLFQLRQEYARLVVLLETLEPGRWFEQSEAFRLQAYDALRALISRGSRRTWKGRVRVLLRNLSPALCHR